VAVTANGDVEAARRYHEQTRHSPRSVRESGHVLDWENKPSPFKIYPDLPVVPLPRQVAPLPADTFAALSGPASASGAVDLERLAALLFFSAGVTKTKTYAGGAHVYFRAAPSTGALYQTEAYVIAGDVAGLAAGVYHFGPGDFALRRLRAGDFRGAVAGAAADEEVAARPVILALTGLYWRNTWKYQARGYRHLFWDAGTMLANALASASALGLSARAVVGFIDDDVNGLLGIDPEREGALVLVAVGGAARPAQPPPPIETIAPAVVPLSASEVSYPLLVDAYVNSRLVSEAEVLDWRERAPGMAAAAPPPAPLLAPLPPPLMTAGRSLAETIQARGSTREFSGEAIAAEALSSALYHASRGFAADVPPGLVDLYLAIHAVDGVAPGAYVYHPGPHALELIRAGDVRAAAAFLCLGQALGGTSSATVFFLADLGRLLGALGNRGYRAANLEAGLIGGRLYLAAYAQRFGATGLTFYDDEVVEFFSPHAGGKAALFVTALGRSQAAHKGPSASLAPSAARST
jgi:SagB-type dehydrogenase family enzyme